MDKQAELIGIYDFNELTFLVEMIINDYPDEIDYCSFYIPDEKLDKSDWQTAYMEQYLDMNGIGKLCSTYATPAKQSKPSRIAFFLFKTGALELSTPYGEFSLTNPHEVPDRLAKTIDFDDFG